MGKPWLLTFDPNAVDGSEILHHLGCIKPCKQWENYQPQLVSRISSINSMALKYWLFYFSADVEGDSPQMANTQPEKIGL